MKRGTPIRLPSGEIGIIALYPKISVLPLIVATGNAVRYTRQQAKAKDLKLVEPENLGKDENETLNYLYQHLLNEIENDQAPF